MPPKKVVIDDKLTQNACSVYEFTHYQLRKHDADILLDKEGVHITAQPGLAMCCDPRLGYVIVCVYIYIYIYRERERD